MIRLVFVSLLFAALTAVSASASEYVQIPVVRLEAEAVVDAPAEEVWASVTTGRSLVTWCPYWKAEGNAGIVLTKVGDILDFTDSWGNGGQSVVTYIEPGKEIRIAHEPTDGSYLCQARIVLSPSGTGTQVLYVEQYTDGSAPEDRDATAEKMGAEMDATLAKLKALVEK